MNRREVIKTVGLMVGGTIIGADAFLLGCTNKKNASLFPLQKYQIDLFEEIAETILPRTDSSPGAKDTEIGKFMNEIVNDYYNPIERKVFLEGLEKFKEINFIELTKDEKEALLLSEEKEVKVNPKITMVNSQGKNEEITHFYLMIKQLAIWGFLSSEIVAKKGFNYVPIPGRFDGCIDVTEDTKPMF